MAFFAGAQQDFEAAQSFMQIRVMQDAIHFALAVTFSYKKWKFILMQSIPNLVYNCLIGLRPSVLDNFGSLIKEVKRSVQVMNTCRLRLLPRHVGQIRISFRVPEAIIR